MARLHAGEKTKQEKQVWYLLRQYMFGLREVEMAEMLGWQRRTTNNYLRALRRQGCAYKDGRCWLADNI